MLKYRMLNTAYHLPYLQKVKPVLRPIYHSLLDVLDDKEVLRRNLQLKDIYRGQRCFLLFTGSSLNSLDITLLKNEHTLSCSHIYKHDGIEKLDLKIYVDTEPIQSALFSPNYDAKIFGPWSPDGFLTKFLLPISQRIHNPHAIFLFNHANRKYIENTGVFNGRQVYYLKHSKPMGEAHTPVVDLTKRITSGGSFENLIAVALYMGFAEIYLCGAGYTYKPTWEFHFYDGFAFPKSLGLERAMDEAKSVVGPYNKRKNVAIEYRGLMERPDHYVGIYAREAPVSAVHKKIREVVESAGARIYNIVSEGFESPVYEKLTWQEVVQNVLRTKAARKAMNLQGKDQIVDSKALVAL